MFKEKNKEKFLRIRNVSDEDSDFCNLNNFYRIKNSVRDASRMWSLINLNFHYFYVNSEDIQIGCNENNGVMFLCYPYIMMIDFDETEEFKKIDAISVLEKFTEKVETELNKKIFFRIYETDRGIHAFLTTHYVDPKSDDTMRVLIQLCSDEDYAVFTKFRGFCVRISPKPLVSTNDFTSRYCYQDICGIGSGKDYEIKDIVNKLDFHTAMINFLNNYYRNLTFDDRLAILKSNKVRNTIRNKINEEAKKYNINISGHNYPIRSEKMDLYKGYENILDKKLLRECKDISFEKIDQMSRHVLKKFDFDKNIYLLGKKGIIDTFEWKTGKMVPENSEMIRYLEEVKGNYVLSFDSRKGIFFIIFEDLLTLDWDEKDGYTVEMVEDLLQQFIDNDNANLKKKRGLFDSPITFRIYKTDNGIHAYCTSHRIPYNSLYAKIIMKSLCIDPWYIYVSTGRGYSSRLSPKRETHNQFVFRPILNEYSQRKIIGDGAESPITLFLLDFKTEIKNYIVSSTNYDIINSFGEDIEKDAKYFEELKYQTIKIYDDLKNSVKLDIIDINNLLRDAKENGGEIRFFFEENLTIKLWETERSTIF